MENPREKECTILKMDTTKATSKTGFTMEKVKLYGTTETNIVGNLPRARCKEKESTNNKTEMFTKENTKKESNMEWVALKWQESK